MDKLQGAMDLSFWGVIGRELDRGTLTEVLRVQAPLRFALNLWFRGACADSFGQLPYVPLRGDMARIRLQLKREPVELLKVHRGGLSGRRVSWRA